MCMELYVTQNTDMVTENRNLTGIALDRKNNLYLWCKNEG